ncbi:MAG: hypothetical protein DDT18_01369 [Actinobacteria bacterium]|nr:hypothetical protein [Actinomycetota bacterium]
MKTIVVDSCSLILLSKCSLLETLAESFPLVIPKEVFHEVVNKDTLTKYPDAGVISNLVSAKRIRVVGVDRTAKKLPISLGKGELEAVALVKQTAGSILLTDDGRAIKACRYMKLPFLISPRITVELYRLGKIDFTKAKNSIEKLRIIGRYPPDIIAEALLKLEEIEDAKTNNG